jgi:hypothetical protein
MRRLSLPLLSLALITLVAPNATAFAQSDPVQNATSAAPPSVSDSATVMDASGKVLRQGTNGWTCLPDNPAVANNSPMCVDSAWLSFMDAFMNKRQPTVKSVGIAYMLQGDMPVSNTDPFATAPTPTNQWVENSGPHLMMIVPDAQQLDAISTDPNNGGPWVMWKGTPYAHIMVPVPR